MPETIHDRDIREPLFDFLEDSFGKIRIIEEKTMGKSRADIVMVTENEIYGIEIKSDADSYARLSRQVKDYDKFFDKNIVVVGTSHAMHIEEHVPDYWGIITVEESEDGLDFYTLRNAKTCPKSVLKNKLSILWRTELQKIQIWANMAKYKDKRKDFVIDKIIALVPEKINEQELNVKISEILFERDYTTIQDEIKEYRKGEIQKALESEADPKKKLELMMEQAEKSKNFKVKKRRRRRK